MGQLESSLQADRNDRSNSDLQGTPWGPGVLAPRLGHCSVKTNEHVK